MANPVRYLAVVALALTIAVPARAQDADPAPELRGAVAGVFLPGPFARDFTIETTIALPKVPTNRGSYAVWLMLAARPREEGDARFVEIGLGRSSQKVLDLAPFVATRRIKGKLSYALLPRTPNAPHVVRIRGNDRTFSIYFDNAEVYGLTRGEFFTKDDYLYAEIGTEVFAPGDRASGELLVIRSKGDRDRSSRRRFPGCTSSDRGLSWLRTGERFFASGVYDPARPAGIAGCTNFGS